MRRAVVYSCRVAGLLLFALWLTVYLSVEFGAEVSPPGRQLPASGDVYLTAMTKADITCTITPANGDSRTVTLSDHSVLHWGSAVGTRVHRWFSGPAVVGCTGGQVHLTGGWLVWLSPLGTTFLVPLAAAILVVLGWRDRFLPHRRVRA
jgi:hypothetical protein